MKNNLKNIFFTKGNKGESARIRYFPLQYDILNKLNANDYALVFDEPGTGKMIQGIYAIWDIIQKKKKGENTNILILTPNKLLATQWKESLESFLKLEFTIAGNDRSNENIYYKKSSDNLFISYNSSNYENLGMSKLNPLPKREAFFNNRMEVVEKENIFLKLNSGDNPKSSIVDREEAREFEKMGRPIYSLFERFINSDEEELKFTYYMGISNIYATTIGKASWDLIIMDELHDFYDRYLNILYSDSSRIKKEVGLNPNYQDLVFMETDKLLVLSATPLSYFEEASYDGKSNSTEDIFGKVVSGPKNLLRRHLTEEEEKIKMENFLKFDKNIPYQRYFKEVVINKDDYRTRKVELLEYDGGEIFEKVWINNGNRNTYFGNIFRVLSRELQGLNSEELEETQEILKVYEEPEYGKDDIECLKDFDRKLNCLLEYSESIIDKRFVLFFEYIETKNYLEKVFKALNYKVFSLYDSSGPIDDIDERFGIISSYNDFDSKEEGYEGKIILSSWRLGNYGINLHGGDRVICYEATSSLNSIEQGFGRIDRLDYGFSNINLILFKADKHYYDTYRLNMIYSKLFNFHLNKLPTKNFLFTVDYLNEYINNVYKYKKFYSDLDYNARFKSCNAEDLIFIGDFFTEYELIQIEDDLFVPERIKVSELITRLDRRKKSYRENYEEIENYFNRIVDILPDLKGKIEQSPGDYLKGMVYYLNDDNELSIKYLDTLRRDADEYVAAMDRDFEISVTQMDEYIDSGFLNSWDADESLPYNDLLNSMIIRKIKEINK